MKKLLWGILVLLISGAVLAFLIFDTNAQSQENETLIVGRVLDAQDQPVEGATVNLVDRQGEVILENTTQPNGQFELLLPGGEQAPNLPGGLGVKVARVHFTSNTVTLNPAQIQRLENGLSVVLPDVVLKRKIGIAFWIATLVFLGVLAVVAAGILHNTLAALAGASFVLGVSYLGPILNEDLFIFDFQRALHYVDWNVIFLVLGMMIVIAIVEGTGIFQWLAFTAHRLSGGRPWLLITILMVITSVASAFLDNVTTMLLMTPITVQIALALDMSPLALLMPEVLASNVGGISTLVGTPTNILIGSFARISFSDFLINLTPGVVLALIALAIYSLWIYRRDLQPGRETSPMLLEKLEQQARITEPGHLKKFGWVGAGMLILFVFGENIHLVPAVTALMGATVLLLWVRPDVEEMIEAVDWTTLIFFIALFIVVGAIQEVGLISYAADVIGRLVGANLVLAMFAVIWSSALLSTVIANIPFTAAMLPVIAHLTAIVPGAQGKVFFYSLSVGSAMGGNGSLIGASANMVTSGIAERAGYPITYMYFLKKGFPALLITVSLATLWLFLRFLVFTSAGG